MIDYAESTMIKRFLLTALLLISLTPLFPSGIKDRLEFKSLLEEKYPQLIQSVSLGQLSASEAKEQLRNLREEYNIAYDDEAGIIDSFIDQLEEGEISETNALLYYSYLKDKRMPDLQREAGNSNIRNYQNELIGKFEDTFRQLTSGLMKIDEAIGEMETFQRSSGFLRNRMFVQLQTLLLSFRSGAITEPQLSSQFRKIKKDWEESLEDEKEKGRTGASGGSVSTESSADEEEEEDDDDDDEPAEEEDEEEDD